MPVTAIDPAGFEAKFRADIDPWDYRASRLERVKRRDLLLACGHRPYGRVLELACAIGVTSRALAPISLRLLALDSSPTAIREAQKGGKDLKNVTFRLATLPAEMPAGPFDLIVVSELAYYLPPAELARLAKMLGGRLSRGGRVVVLHHLRPFRDAAIHPALAHGRLVRLLARALVPDWRRQTARYRVDGLVKP
ncbi:class I SAM-dependent methyltransferase [Afifella sp. IM 167]|uniref:class I SAM-dependent methyltransferase n=1 Tax=Afifella sp. IM 167 TaxID=2033586 RepID=UPI001CCCDF55|nr:SAM-dependent methyltransferase [Afifella sp. IM 167]MBZ8133397.1 SAM-dependent methyltransferase [Afifella sp. IM 167]